MSQLLDHHKTQNLSPFWSILKWIELEMNWMDLGSKGKTPHVGARLKALDEAVLMAVSDFSCNLYIYKIVANFDLIPRTTARAFDLQGWNFNMYCAILWRWYINFFKVIDQLVWAWDGKMCSDSAQFCRHHLNFWGHPTFPIHLRTTMVRVNFQNFVLKWILLCCKYGLAEIIVPYFQKGNLIL